MTPKDKAKDLVRDMEFEIPYIQDPTEPQSDDIAKKCALIAVDLIIYHTEEDSSNIPLYEYYSEVKQEILKL
jgi:hypothetical protein